MALYFTIHFSEKPAMQTCLDEVKELCKSTYIDTRVENLNMTLMGCEYTGKSGNLIRH